MLVDALPTAAAELVESARRTLDADRVADLVEAMTAIPSPSGEELPLARFLAEHMTDAGLRAEVQSVHGTSANAIGRFGRAEADAPRLLLYGAIDTAFSGQAREDEPWLGAEPRADFALPPTRDGHRIVGLGAENPKAFAAAGIAAVEALTAAGADLQGEVVLGLVGGSMPIIDRPEAGLRGVGHGRGIRHLLANEARPDFAIVLKPGYAVSNEEVGLAWFRLYLHGTVNYTGIRHKTSYRNPIVFAGRVIEALERWFPDYARENGDGVVLPQASINAVRAGDVNRLAFSPQVCEIDVDIRVPPQLSVADVASKLREVLAGLRAADPDLDVEVAEITSMPGTLTDPDNWVVRSLVNAWEWREQKEHVPARNASGATDVALIRAAGIPTARIGLPPPAGGNPFDGFSMGVADADGIVRLSEVLIRAVVDTCARSRADVGVR
jgi:acetylornithine deacetylase/succinyl-diaminopimelate desuccinylase-like protein